MYPGVVCLFCGGFFSIASRMWRRGALPKRKTARVVSTGGQTDFLAGLVRALPGEGCATGIAVEDDICLRDPYAQEIKQPLQELVDAERCEKVS